MTTEPVLRTETGCVLACECHNGFRLLGTENSNPDMVAMPYQDVASWGVRSLRGSPPPTRG